MTAADSPAAERLNRFLARRGVCSRRGADVLIRAGRVRVNGRVAALGEAVDSGDLVEVDGQRLMTPPPPRTIALNKPVGVVCTRSDPEGRPTVMDLIDASPSMVSIGRLDADSRGLLLLTTDGDLAHRVAHPRYQLHKRYRVVVRPRPTPRQVERLRGPLQLDDGPARAVAVTRVAETTLEIVMAEGRRREVRRMAAAVGLDVVDLCRQAVGPVELGSLGQGRWRPLRSGELTALRQAVGLVGDGSPQADQD